MLAGAIFTVSWAIPLGLSVDFNKRFAESENIISEQKNIFDQNIAKNINLDNFNVATLNISRDNSKYLIKLFGSSNVEELKGMRENQYFNIIFNISEENAIKIINLAKNFYSLSGNEDINSDRLYLNNQNFSGVLLHKKDRERLSNINDTIIELYQSFNNAVSNAYSKNVEKVSEASSMNNSISEAYRYTRPEVISDVNISGLFVSGSTTFINCGIMTTNISQVVKDNERDVSYFLIDTLQGRENNGKMIIEKCQSRVEVKGTDLTQEEVYAKFIAGEYSNFIEISRDTFSKTYIMNNELVDDVENIELF